MNKQTILRFLKYIVITFLTLFIALFLLGGGVFLYFVSKAPALSESKLVATTSSKIYDNKNELIADLGSERRVNAQANEIPTDLVKAIVSIEDHRFFDHRGVDTIRIMGAALRNLQGGGLQGASTLTQQLIKLNNEFDSNLLIKDIKKEVMPVKLDWGIEGYEKKGKPIKNLQGKTAKIEFGVSAFGVGIGGEINDKDEVSVGAKSEETSLKVMLKIGYIGVRKWEPSEKVKKLIKKVTSNPERTAENIEAVKTIITELRTLQKENDDINEKSKK